MSGNFENNQQELELLEDKDIEVKEKVKHDHKIEPDDCFYRVKLPYNNVSKVCRIKNPDIKRGFFLVVPTPYGPEIGIVQGRVTDMDDILSQEEILEVIRIATKNDREKFKENQKKAKDAYVIAEKKIKEHNLEMKLTNVHFFLEESKVLFNFTADNRVDFRELIKDLASIFKTRIELRQIGVRDECRILRGYGHCGRPYCCADVCNELKPITIKMAKEQNITLNSLKISGACGRLLCCLAYEYETYLEEKKNYPELGSQIELENNVFMVTDVNIQTRTIKLYSSENDSYQIVNLDDIEFDKEKKKAYFKE